MDNILVYAIRDILVCRSFSIFTIIKYIEGSTFFEKTGSLFDIARIRAF